MLSNFSYFFLSSDIFQHNYLQIMFFQEYHLSAEQLGYRWGLAFCCAWSRSKLFQRLSADDKIIHNCTLIHLCWHRLEKYLNLEGFLEKSLKIWKVLENPIKPLKSPWILLFSVGINIVDRDLNQNKTVVPLFGAANDAPNEGTTILYQFFNTNFSIISV